jgi:hypothetical protein
VQASFSKLMQTSTADRWQILAQQRATRPDHWKGHPMQQLQIGDFWQDGSVKAKEKGKAKARAKNTTKR